MIAAIAWVLAGMALWFTRAVLDISGNALHSTRVAMLPSIPELAGLIVLALAISAGVAAIVRRLPGGSDQRERARLQIALPLFSLGLILFPFLPLAPDLLLPARALAGPLALIIWSVVTGHLVVTFLAILREDRGHSRSSGVASVAVFVATLAATSAAAIRMRDTVGYPSGNEPHYLLTMQSLVRDGDVTLGNNYERRDYDEYFPTSLAPIETAPTRSGELRSPEPPGFAAIGALPYRIGGYHAVVWMLVLITATVGLLTWRWAFAYTGSADAASLGWAAVFLAAPMIFTGIAVYPDMPAALCVMLALGWRFNPRAVPAHAGDYAIRGIALAALPWLSMTYAPLSVSVAAVLGLRAQGNRKAVGILLALVSASLVAWLTYFGVVWGRWSPLAPFGARTLLGNPAAGALGLLFDQEFGVLAYAPALAIGLVALWRMTRAADPLTRRVGGEIALVFGTLFLSVSVLAAWWGGSPHPARPLVPVLPLLALPIAWASRRVTALPALGAAYRTLVLVQVAIAVSILFAQDGSLVIQDRDGSSRVLQWLSDLWPAWEVAPSIAAFGVGQALPLVGLWLLTAAAVGWVCGRLPWRSPGSAALGATLAIAAGIGAVGLIGPFVSRPPFQWVLEPESRSRVPMLDNFDAVVRPIAVVYNPFTLIEPESVPPLMTLMAFPGQRPGGQPVPVLLNARYALPAGEYEVTLGDLSTRDGARAHGYIGVQVGRVGSPMHEWEVSLEPHQEWRATFSLPADAEFVGFVGDRALQGVSALRLRPLRIVDKHDRDAIFHGGTPLTVYSALQLPRATLLFHDDSVYRESSGIWVRGESTATVTVAPLHPENGVTLQVHSGSRPNTLTFTTNTWGERVNLIPGENQMVRIPAPPTHGPFVLRISAAHGFVPADVLPGSNDRRMLGAWVEVAQ